MGDLNFWSAVSQLGVLLTLIGMGIMSRADSPFKRCKAWSVQLAAQPFWALGTILAQQWGMLFVTAVMTIICLHALDFNFQQHKRYGSMDCKIQPYR